MIGKKYLIPTVGSSDCLQLSCCESWDIYDFIFIFFIFLRWNQKYLTTAKNDSNNDADGIFWQKLYIKKN